jgi:hypothetical protein
VETWESALRPIKIGTCAGLIGISCLSSTRTHLIPSVFGPFAVVQSVAWIEPSDQPSAWLGCPVRYAVEQSAHPRHVLASSLLETLWYRSSHRETLQSICQYVGSRAGASFVGGPPGEERPEPRFWLRLARHPRPNAIDTPQ